jgi:hypothetical protein
MWDSARENGKLHERRLGIRRARRRVSSDPLSHQDRGGRIERIGGQALTGNDTRHMAVLALETVEC